MLEEEHPSRTRCTGCCLPAASGPNRDAEPQEESSLPAAYPLFPPHSPASPPKVWALFWYLLLFLGNQNVFISKFEECTYFVCILQPGNNFSAVLACFLRPSCVWFWENACLLKQKMEQDVTPILLWVEMIKREERKWCESCSIMSNSLWSHGIYSLWNFPARILEWVAYPFSSRSFQSMNRTGVSRIASGFFTNLTITEAPKGGEIKSKSHDLFWRG